MTGQRATESQSLWVACVMGLIRQQFSVCVCVCACVSVMMVVGCTHVVLTIPVCRMCNWHFNRAYPPPIIIGYYLVARMCVSALIRRPLAGCAVALSAGDAHLPGQICECCQILFHLKQLSHARLRAVLPVDATHTI